MKPTEVTTTEEVLARLERELAEWIRASISGASPGVIAVAIAATLGKWMAMIECAEHGCHTADIMCVLFDSRRAAEYQLHYREDEDAHDEDEGDDNRGA